MTYEEQQESLRVEYNPNIDRVNMELTGTVLFPNSTFIVPSILFQGGTGKSFSGKLHDIQDMTLTITKGIEFIAALIERIYK